MCILNKEIQHLATLFYFLRKSLTLKVRVSGKKLNASLTILRQSLIQLWHLCLSLSISIPPSLFLYLYSSSSLIFSVSPFLIRVVCLNIFCPLSFVNVSSCLSLSMLHLYFIFVVYFNQRTNEWVLSHLFTGRYHLWGILTSFSVTDGKTS